MLPELPPPVFASLVGVDVLPSTDYGILQVLNSTGSLDRSFQRNLFDSFNFKIIINSKQLNHIFQYNFRPFFYCRVGILDVFLACIAKGLTLQVKSKGRDKEFHKNPVSTLTMSTIFNGRSEQNESKLGSRWWMRGTMPRRVAESIIQLVRDMASVGISINSQLK